MPETLGELIYAPKLTLKEKIEKILHLQDNSSTYIKKNVYKNYNVLAVIEGPEGDKSKIFADPNEAIIEKIESRNVDERINLIKKWIKGMNLVTNDGDLFYAQSAMSETPTNDFTDASGRQELGNGTQGTPDKTNTYSALQGPITASRKAIDSTYPKTNDGDADNTGAATDTASWLTSWTKADFNDSNITGGVIHDAAGSPVSGSVVLTYWTITAFAKTSDDTLKIFVNHNFLGV